MTLAHGQLALAMLLVGGNVAVAKLLADALPIALIAALRCGLAVLVLWPLARAIDGPIRLRGAARNLFWQAVCGTALYNAGLLAGLRLTSALEAGVVLATLPAVVAIGAAVWLRERPGARGWAAVVLAVLGVAALATVRTTAEAGVWVGNALVFAGVCGETAYVLLARRLGARVPVLTATLAMQLFSLLVLLPFAVPDVHAMAALADPSLLALLVGHSLTASVLCVLLWYAGLRRVPAGVAGVFTVFLPAGATLAAMLWLGERAGAGHVVGLGLMAASVLVATWPRRAPAAAG